MAKIQSQDLKKTKNKSKESVTVYEAKKWGQIARKSQWPKKKKRG